MPAIRLHLIIENEYAIQCTSSYSSINQWSSSRSGAHGSSGIGGGCDGGSSSGSNINGGTLHYTCTIKYILLICQIFSSSSLELQGICGGTVTCTCTM